MDAAPKIYQAMANVMKAVGAIGKDSKNQQQGFNFRGVDEVYNEMHTILAKNDIFTVPTVLSESTEERQTKSGGNLIYRKLMMQYRFYTTDGSYVDAIVLGEGMDSGDKASNKAMSIAHKYAFLQTFSIPTREQKDPDFETHEVAPKTQSFGQTQRPLTGPEAVDRAYQIIAARHASQGSPGDHLVTFGKHKGKRIREMALGDVRSYASFLSKPASDGKPTSDGAKQFIAAARTYLSTIGGGEEEAPAPEHFELTPNNVPVYDENGFPIPF